MRILARIVKWLAILVVVAVAAAAGWLIVAPPDLIRVAASYTAKIVCSNVFLAGRDAGEVLAVDVQAPGHPILKYMRVSVDADNGIVRTGLFGLFGKGMAVRREGMGCATVPDGDLSRLAEAAASPGRGPDIGALWPEGDLADHSQDPAIDAILDDERLTGPGMRAVVVVHNGRIVGERYGAEFSAVTPLLGWSMTKTVTAALIGTLVREEVMSLDQVSLFEAWRGDGRAEIALSDLMAMSSGLAFNEEYGDVTDVTRMLFLEPDMAGFAAARPLEGEVAGTWSYSSGTTVMLSKLWQEALGEPQEGWDWPRQGLFDPIGMSSAVMEADASGTFVGSSYLYATARDWARFGLLLAEDGVWKGERILPEGFVGWMREEAPASNGEYGRGQVWLHGPEAGTPEGEDPDAGFDLPADAFWALGHDGQSMAMIPSKRLVVVRLGLTPSKLGWKSQGLVAALAKAVE